MRLREQDWSGLTRRGLPTLGIHIGQTRDRELYGVRLPMFAAANWENIHAVGGTILFIKLAMS